MMMIKKEKLTADKIYTLFFIRKTNTLPVKDVLIALGSTNAKQVFRFLLELTKKDIIGLDNNYNICIYDHITLLQSVLKLRYESTATFLFTVLKCYKTQIREYLNKEDKNEQKANLFIDVDFVWEFAFDIFDKNYNKGHRYNAINELINKSYLIKDSYFKYKKYKLNIDKIVKEGILDYIKCIHGEYN